MGILLLLRGLLVRSRAAGMDASATDNASGWSEPATPPGLPLLASQPLPCLVCECAACGCKRYGAPPCGEIQRAGPRPGPPALPLAPHRHRRHADAVTITGAWQESSMWVVPVGTSSASGSHSGTT